MPCRSTDLPRSATRRVLQLSSPLSCISHDALSHVLSRSKAQPHLAKAGEATMSLAKHANPVLCFPAPLRPLLVRTFAVQRKSHTLLHALHR